MEKIFIDLDGVIAAFTEFAASKHNIIVPSGEIEDEFLYKQFPRKGDMWKKCLGEEFWVNIPTLPWAESLVNTVDKSGHEWYFLTKIPLDDSGYTGKARWIRKYFPKHMMKLWCVRGNKDAAAGPNKLLIDDKLSNCQRWAAAGGEVYHWREITSDSTDEAERRIVEIKELVK